MKCELFIVKMDGLDGVGTPAHWDGRARLPEKTGALFNIIEFKNVNEASKKLNKASQIIGALGTAFSLFSLELVIREQAPRN